MFDFGFNSCFAFRNFEFIFLAGDIQNSEIEIPKSEITRTLSLFPGSYRPGPYHGKLHVKYQTGAYIRADGRLIYSGCVILPATLLLVIYPNLRNRLPL